MSVEVFISYSSQDYDRVMPLVDRLRSAGAAVWVDEGNIDAATLWSESIVKAISECRVLIMIRTRHSLMALTIDSDQRVAASIFPSSTHTAAPAERSRSTNGMTRS